MENLTIFLTLYFSGFVGFILGIVLNQAAFYFIVVGPEFPPYPIICGQLFLYLSSGIYYAFFWTVPSFLVYILLKHFHDKCRNVNEEFIKNCYACLKLYEELSDSLQYFFFVVYFLMQIWLIFNTFVSMSSVLKMTDITNADWFLVGSYLVVIATGVFCMIMQTEVIDQAFQDLQYLRRQAQEKLLYSSEKSERNQLKFLLRRLEMMEPMNGCGYFGIDKTTLTSMLSVRY